MTFDTVSGHLDNIDTERPPVTFDKPGDLEMYSLTGLGTAYTTLFALNSVPAHDSAEYFEQIEAIRDLAADVLQKIDLYNGRRAERLAGMVA